LRGGSTSKETDGFRRDFGFGVEVSKSVWVESREGEFREGEFREGEFLDTSPPLPKKRERGVTVCIARMGVTTQVFGLETMN
jgi:hypothetical protein